jgi:hypothetical protein
MPAATSSLMTVTLDVPTRTQKATMGFLAGAGGARAFHARSRDGRRAVLGPTDVEGRGFEADLLPMRDHHLGRSELMR